MNNLHYMTSKTLVSWMLNQLTLQQQLVDTQAELLAAQKQIIALQKRIDKMTPKNAPDKEVLWHVHSGMFSKEAAGSDDLETVEGFLKWINGFSRKHLRPYIDPKVYMECLGQMTRGLPERIAELKTRQDIEEVAKHRKALADQARQARQN